MTRFDYAGGLFEAELKVSDQLGDMLGGQAERGADIARGLAPVGGEGDPTPGSYRDSIEAVHGIEDGVQTGRILATDVAAGFIEFGTVDTPTFAPLMRAVEQLGNGG